MDNIITIDVRSREVLAVEQQRPIVAGNVGVDFVDIALDEEWDGLTKRVTFSNAGNDVTVPFATPLEIPHECLTHGYLSISVVGVDADGEEVLRTKAMRKPLVVNASGADMGGEAAPRTMDVAALAEKRMDEIEAAIPAAQAAADNANATAAELRAAAARGDFDGPQGPQGPKGADGTMTFEDLTPEQREQLRGPQGVQGPRGERGEAGPAGAQGPHGAKGDTGATGPQGPAGQDADIAAAAAATNAANAAAADALAKAQQAQTLINTSDAGLIASDLDRLFAVDNAAFKPVFKKRAMNGLYLENRNVNPTSSQTAQASTLAGYNSAEYIITRDTLIGYRPQDIPSYYYGITVMIGNVQVYDGNTRWHGDSVIRYRNSDGNLPTEENPLSVPAGSHVFVVMNKPKENFFLMCLEPGTELTSDVVLDGAQVEQVLVDMPNITEDKTAFLHKKFAKIEAIDLDGVVVDGSGYNWAPDTSNAIRSSLPGYTSYRAWATSEYDIYVNPSDNDGSYKAITVLRNSDGIERFRSNGDLYFAGSECVRYRSSEGNLPTLENPLHVNAGDYVMFTASTAIFIRTSQGQGYHFPTLALTRKQLDGTGAGAKDCIVTYTENASAFPSRMLHVYQPTGTGYVEYVLSRHQMDTVNSNVWHMHNAYWCDDSLSRIRDLTADGEWECAIRLAGRPDFSGGIAHGDEIFTDFHVLIDGREFDPSEITGEIEFSSLRVTQVSDLYDPNDSTTVFAKHGREYVFNADGIEISQRIDWLLDEQTETSYLAMFTPSKACTDTVYTDTDYTNYAIEQKPDGSEIVTKSWYGAKKGVIFGSESGILGVFEVVDYPYHDTDGRLVLQDNGGGSYNKMYQYINGRSVTAGTVWKAKTKYKFECRS